jgi:hypothetical protein
MPVEIKPELAGRRNHPPWYDGIARVRTARARSGRNMPIVLAPSTWLLGSGWRKLGELSVYDGPSTALSARGLPS